jgi:hypothetical protein
LQLVGGPLVTVAAIERRLIMPNKPMDSKDAVPQSDQQASADVAQHQGQEGEQAKVINQQETAKRQDKK